MYKSAKCDGESSITDLLLQKTNQQSKFKKLKYFPLTITLV